jgi:serine/threonine protein kinase
LKGNSLIKDQKNVLVKISTSEELVFNEIITQLVLYEKKVDFGENHLAKMIDYFNFKNAFHIIYEYPGAPLVHSMDELRIEFDIARIRNFASQILHSINKLHEFKIAHLLIDPRSIFVNFDRPETHHSNFHPSNNYITHNSNEKFGQIN